MRHLDPETSPDTTGRAGAILLALVGLLTIARTGIAGGPALGYVLGVVVVGLGYLVSVVPWGSSHWLARAWIPALTLLVTALSGMMSPTPEASAAALVALACVAACVYTGLLCPGGIATGLAFAAGVAAYVGLRHEGVGHAITVAIGVTLSGAALGELVAFGLTPSRVARERAQHRAQMLSAVADASRRLHKRDLSGVIDGLLEGVRRMGFPGVALVSFDHSSPIELGDRIPHLDDLVESVKLRKRPTVYPPVAESGRNSGALVGIPVFLEGDVRAALLARGLPGLVMQHSDVEALELFADQAGRALENARAAEVDRRRVAELSDVALRDELTGLGNRRHGIAVLDGAVDGDVVAVVDVDGLKHANDTYGHAMGDQILANLGRYLRQQVRIPDEVARIGGDEFMIVLRRASDTAEAILERLRENWTPLGNGTTLSIGMAIHTGDRLPAETMHLADQALYEAKRNGRNRVRLAIVPAA